MQVNEYELIVLVSNEIEVQAHVTFLC